MKREYRLKSKAQIEHLFQRGYRIKSKGLALHYLENSQRFLVGFSVPKRKISSAVDRNRIKRMMRASFDQIIGEYPLLQESPVNIMFVYHATHEIIFEDLKLSMKTALKKLAKKFEKNEEN